MTDRPRILIGRWMAVVAIGSALAGMVWVIVLSRDFQLLWSEWLLHNGTAAIGFGLIAWSVIPAQPRNGTVWTSAWVGVFSGLFCLTTAASFQLAAAYGMSIEAVYGASPSDFPPLTALVPMMSSWLYIPMFLSLTVGLLLFPDGSPPSPRWRWVTWTTILAIAVDSVALMWLFRPSSTLRFDSVYGFADVFGIGPVVAIAEAIQLVMVPVCVVGMIVRFRRSTGIERQQFRLVVWGAAAAGLLILLAALTDFSGAEGARLLFLTAIVVLIGSYGVAIARYRLYDIDIVISRTFVYGALGLFITAVYIAIVVGLGFLLDTGGRKDIWLGIVATVFIAIAFQPLRRWLQRVANRIVYGRRATPYEVLSSFSQGVSAVDPAVLVAVAKSLAEGTTADSASIWIDRGGSLQCIAAWPDLPGEAPSPSGISAPVVHDGDQLGSVSLEVRPGQPFPVTDQHLLDQVAAGLGLALRNLLLTEDLRARVGQLAASRRRIVTVQDQTRRKLERDLHDGAQQRLVALKIKLGIGATIAAKTGLDDVETILNTVRDETDQTIDAVRDFARGIYPPLLESEGLGPALSAQTRKLPIPVTVQAPGLARYPKDIEATVYFCVLEALHNAVDHSDASLVQLVIGDREGALSFEVRDDGIGFDIREVTRHGLVNITDRVEAVGGVLRIESGPGRGTQVIGILPVVEPVLA